ncbi:hypothetical protein LAZ40_02395 [Cereibacter sphaeroides]|uniref:hypothetical protein n=1 Tax=Cereibacter sphaeroides TaxID=1063 RepID=UPI001F162263|nr:hypothetical protein [Cereibacter sphaeroides]MCE6957908.1 hypothetical protein [Cereibacter sphaeroides]MCE6971744.1 hypothetical protein [Cereibacter sphaeroides]
MPLIDIAISLAAMGVLVALMPCRVAALLLFGAPAGVALLAWILTRLPSGPRERIEPGGQHERCIRPSGLARHVRAARATAYVYERQEAP